MRVLVVDDEVDLRSVVMRALAADGHVVTTASNLETARELLVEGPDLVVLDLGLPDGSGLTLCRALRAEGSTVPILILTANSEVARRVEGLDAGADDFLSKPFSIAELRARVRALGRRGTLPRGLRYTFNDVVIDFAGRRAMKKLQPIAVTSREWAILELLGQHEGRVVSRSDLLEGVWGDATDAASGSLEVLIGRLRRKLGPDLIETLRGEGYSLVKATHREAKK